METLKIIPNDDGETINFSNGIKLKYEFDEQDKETPHCILGFINTDKEELDLKTDVKVLQCVAYILGIIPDVYLDINYDDISLEYAIWPTQKQMDKLFENLNPNTMTKLTEMNTPLEKEIRRLNETFEENDGLDPRESYLKRMLEGLWRHGPPYDDMEDLDNMMKATSDLVLLIDQTKNYHYKTDLIKVLNEWWDDVEGQRGEYSTQIAALKTFLAYKRVENLRNQPVKVVAGILLNMGIEPMENWTWEDILEHLQPFWFPENPNALRDILEDFFSTNH